MSTTGLSGGPPDTRLKTLRVLNPIPGLYAALLFYRSSVTVIVNIHAEVNLNIDDCGIVAAGGEEVVSQALSLYMHAYIHSHTRTCMHTPPLLSLNRARARVEDAPSRQRSP